MRCRWLIAYLVNIRRPGINVRCSHYYDSDIFGNACLKKRVTYGACKLVWKVRINYINSRSHAMHALCIVKRMRDSEYREITYVRENNN